MTRLALPLVIALALTASGCASSAQTPPPPQADASPVPTPAPPQAACDADAARGVIGQTATQDVVEKARLAAGAQIARTLKPNQVVTMEYHSSRLNIDVTESNVVTGVRCG